MDPTPDLPDPPDPPAMPEVFEAAAPRSPRGFTAVAWLVILAGVAAAVGLQQLSKAAQTGGSEAGEDKLGLTIMKMQSQYMVAANEIGGEAMGVIYEQAYDTLYIGSVGQRQRFVVLAGDLVDDATALEVLDDLDALAASEALRTEGEEKPFALSADQQRVNALLRQRYGTPEASLNDDDRAFLESQLNWFADLALDTEGAARDDVLAPANKVFALFIGAFFAGAGGAFIGFVGLIVLVVLTLTGRVRGNVLPTTTHHGIYAETFGIWIWLFLGTQVGASVVAMAFPDRHSTIIVACGFFASLAALAWPVIRGVPWTQVREDVGLTLGRRPAVEPLVGVGGYLMGLPILAVGVAMTFLLLMLQQALTAGEEATFGAGGGPAHPVIQELAGPDWWPKIQVLIVASIAAPVVEETFFRGVLYRHLRDWTRGSARAVSVILSATVSGFVFAIIHPQGWVAVPVLMSLAYAFCIVREWRGTLIPAMVIHAISNGLVMSLLITAVGA